MPIINIDTTPLTGEQKEKIVTSVTKSMTEITGMPVQAMIVVIRESPAENFGVAGTQVSRMTR